MITLSTVGSWAFVAYLLGAAFFIAIRATPDGKEKPRQN